MPAYNFQKQFVPMIIGGQKPHTIRKRRKRPTQVGDVLMLYMGMRTKKAFMFARTVCTKVEPVVIYPTIEKIMKYGDLLSKEQVQHLALADGFQNVGDFFAFFRDTYAWQYELPDFEIIHWNPAKLEAWLPLADEVQDAS